MGLCWKRRVMKLGERNLYGDWFLKTRCLVHACSPGSNFIIVSKQKIKKTPYISCLFMRKPNPMNSCHKLPYFVKGNFQGKGGGQKASHSHSWILYRETAALSWWIWSVPGAGPALLAGAGWSKVQTHCHCCLWKEKTNSVTYGRLMTCKNTLPNPDGPISLSSAKAASEKGWGRAEVLCGQVSSDLPGPYSRLSLSSHFSSTKFHRWIYAPNCWLAKIISLKGKKEVQLHVLQCNV